MTHVAAHADLTSDPHTNCGNGVLSTDDKNVYTTVAQDKLRTHFLDARTNFTNHFNVVNPPNAPSCTSQPQTNAALSYNSSTTDVATANSRHSGGVNVSLADGSVRFVSDTVNTATSGVTTPKEKSEGKSDFGVWGAMGTVDGGESDSL